MNAQKSYSAANQGYFAAQESCLSEPSRCIPGYSGASLWATRLTDAPHSGYVYTLYPGRTFRPDTAPKDLSPSSTKGFAFVAHPLNQAQDGNRAFCVDGSGAFFMFIPTDTPETPSLIETLDREPWVRCSSKVMTPSMCLC